MNYIESTPQTNLTCPVVRIKSPSLQTSVNLMIYNKGLFTRFFVKWSVLLFFIQLIIKNFQSFQNRDRLKPLDLLTLFYFYILYCTRVNGSYFLEIFELLKFIYFSILNVWLEFFKPNDTIEHNGAQTDGRTNECKESETKPAVDWYL